ncbi:hypothetical protein [Nocardia brevicatena]|uniref:hypothetical protein n=1 Tax=Nocardia brevicatena TaxID=37327 RepID=UPI001C3F481A|nr:hypothetical protein [Nocardia brevicatena]
MGLFIAWEKATGRISSALEAVQKLAGDIRAKLTGRRAATVHLPTATAIARAEGGLTARAVAHHHIDTNQTAEQQLEGLAAETRAIREAITDLHEYIARVEGTPHLEASDVETAITEALENFRSDLNISTGKDFCIAIWGIAITVTGMGVGLMPSLIELFTA